MYAWRMTGISATTKACCVKIFCVVLGKPKGKTDAEKGRGWMPFHIGMTELAEIRVGHLSGKNAATKVRKRRLAYKKATASAAHKSMWRNI